MVKLTEYQKKYPHYQTEYGKELNGIDTKCAKCMSPVRKAGSAKSGQRLVQRYECTQPTCFWKGTSPIRIKKEGDK